MRPLLIGLIMFCTLQLHSQNSQLTFGTAENEENYPMIRLANGDFVLAGMTRNPGFGGKDVFVTRTDSTGNILWSKQYGGTGDETAISISQAPDLGFVLGGETFSVDPDGDAFVFKIDSLGTLQWWKNYGTALYDITYSVFALSDGSIASAGLMETAPLNYEAFLMKTDANGDTLWTKLIGQSGIDHAVTVIQTSDSGFVFCGKTLSVGQGSCDCWIVKTDADGDTLWTSVIGGQGWDESMDIIEQANGYVICGGSNSQGNSNYDFILMNLDLNGNLVWVKQYGGTWVEDSYCVQEVAGEGYVFAGYTETFSYTNSRGNDSANAWIVKTDYNGDTLWSMVYGGNLKEECFSVALLPNGALAFSGYTQSFADSLETYLFFTDSAGYTGCNERRTAPTVFSPSFVQGNYSFNISAGYSVSTPSMSQMNSGAQRNSVCTPAGALEFAGAVPQLLFPNPNSGNFTITSDHRFIGANIYNVNGELISSLSSVPVYSLDMELNSPAGMYFVEMKFENGTVLTRKLVLVQRN